VIMIGRGLHTENLPSRATSTRHRAGGFGMPIETTNHLRQPDDLSTCRGGDSWLCGPTSR
jgi:hypothetical protein